MNAIQLVYKKKKNAIQLISIHVSIRLCLAHYLKKFDR